ncbi:quinone-dependent dihydroorotate dehydrogenase [Porphyrobacter algicida]|uniref:Dihydroorotate dehydrogenase (quinone) n=1 Tax=Qipengyuania algicida TaxID=1836209 RepID=A0A845AGW6_9SPHN|nr:quinone-dependent dihydroorotate dehydrogenase [Qipengyuania algicida]MXP28065.1 quinone-dependent dihydroorotate dehydrogenase [Qipengyuania algicida]
MLFRLLRPALFTLPPERAHRLTLAMLRTVPIPTLPGSPGTNGPLTVEMAGLRFNNPVGLAAGFDKNAEVPDAMLRLGFGFVECGSITPLPQAGNPQPRLFRLSDANAVINRMGFNNDGLEMALGRLERRAQKRSNSRGILGINIGANKDSPDRIADYAVMARAVSPFADYLAVNISSPNTPGLRALQEASALAELLDAVLEARGQAGPPVFLKVAPDLDPPAIDAIARLVIDRKLGALIVSNTTIERPGALGPLAQEAGGLSGAPLKPLALERLRDFRKATGGALPLIGVGGIASVEDAWERIRAGASLVQLYSALVYEGPGLARKIVHGIEQLMKRDGFSSISEAVGTR